MRWAEEHLDDGISFEVGPEQIGVSRRVIDVAAVQNINNLTTRQWDDVVEYCTRERLPFVPWYPVMNGALAQPGGVAAEVAAEPDRRRHRSHWPGCWRAPT